MRIYIKVLFIILISTGGYAQSSGLIDSLKLELEKCDNAEYSKQKKAYLLLQLSYYTNYNPNESRKYSKQALELAQDINRKDYEACAYSYLGTCEKQLGNNLKSIDYFIKCANIFNAIKNYQEEGKTFSTIGQVFSSQGDVTNALAYYNRSLKILESFHDTLFQASVQNNIGEVYRKAELLDSSIYYYNLSLENLKALSRSSHQFEIEQIQSTTIGNLGMAYLKKGNYDRAKENLIIADQYFSASSDPYRKSVYQSELGKLYILEGKVQKGEKLINECMEMAKEAQLKEQIRDFSLELSGFYEQQKKPELALNYFKQYKVYDDSLKNVENVRKLEQQQSQFQLSRKDEEIASLNKINRLQQILGIVLFIGVLTVIVFIFIVSRANKRIKVINQQITEQKQLVEEREKEKALLLRELNHRVKNNLQMVASLLNLHARQLKDHPAAEALTAGRYRVEALTLIHQKLYRDDIDTKIDLKDYIEELAQNLVMNFSRDFNLDLHLESFIMKIDKAIPLGLILNELLTNSLKYGKVEGKQPLLKITVEKTEETIRLYIQDNGQGLPADFDFRKTDSFGLKLVHSLINQLSGTIEWESTKGTQWIITLQSNKIS